MPLKILRSATVLLALVLIGGAGDAPVKPAGNDNRIFVAVGYGLRRMNSRDGVHWENVQQAAENGGDDANNLCTIAFGKGKFVAVGGSFPGRIMVSSDGKDWHEAAQMKFRVHPILFAPDFAGGRFIAGGPDRTLYYSDDGEHWTAGAKIEVKLDPDWAMWFRCGVYGNGTFLFRGNGGDKQKQQWFATTHDGQSILASGADLPEGAGGVSFGAGKFVMVAPGGVCLSSADGAKWDSSKIAGGEELRYVVWTGKNFYAGGGKASFISPDAITWTKVADHVPCEVLYADEASHIFIGSSWPGTMWSSPDGVKWTKGEPLPKDGINSVACGEIAPQK